MKRRSIKQHTVLSCKIYQQKIVVPKKGKGSFKRTAKQREKLHE
jgi:stalled ribosome alternative rescue factor ArfA